MVMMKMCINTEKCCECGSCAHFCKQHGIDFDYSAREYKIDQERCIDCRTCKDYCPIDGALFEVNVAHPLAVF